MMPRGVDLCPLGQGCRPEILSQTKDKVVSSECAPWSKAPCGTSGRWFEEHPSEARAIVGKVIEAAAAREAARKGARA